MSSLNLNLLPSQAKFQASKIKLQKQVRLVIIGLISVWLVVVTAVFGLNMATKIRIEAMDGQYKKAQSDYLKMSDNIVISQQLKYKTKMVGEVLTQRFEYSKSFETVRNLFPEGIIIKKFDLNEKHGFDLECVTSGKENIDYLEKILIDINSGKDERLVSASLNDLSLVNGEWNFKIEVKLR